MVYKNPTQKNQLELFILDPFADHVGMTNVQNNPGFWATILNAIRGGPTQAPAATPQPETPITMDPDKVREWNSGFKK